MYKEWGLAASYVLRHKKDKRGKPLIDPDTGWLKWEKFEPAFKEEAEKRLREL